MFQVLQDLNSGKTYLEEMAAPTVAPGQVLIQTSRSLISPGTERMLVEFGRGNLISKARSQPEKVRQVLDKISAEGLLPTMEAVFAKLNEPMPLGYCNVGKVLDVGEGVRGFSKGDRVISNGNHAEVVSIGQNLCAKVPDGVSDDEAVFTVLSSIALQGVRLAAPTLGETVFVMGLGLVGLVTAKLLELNGCRVIGSDFSKSRLELGKQFGCHEVVDLSSGADPVKTALSMTGGIGVDAVLITAATKSNEPITQSAQMCRKRGRIVLVGVAGLQLNRSDFYEKEQTFQVSCSYGPGRYDADYEQNGVDYPIGFVRWTEQRNFEAILALMERKQLDPTPLISSTVPFEEAGKAYDMLVDDSSALGIMLKYGTDEKRAADVGSPVLRTPDVSDAVTGGVAIIGGGNFTRRTLLPAIKKAGKTPRMVATASGRSGAQTARKFSIPVQTTDTDAVMAEKSVDTVVITTRHDSHAELAIKAIEAGKHIFLEKPMALTMEELARIVAAYRKHGKGLHFMLGFNRRFSPHFHAIKRAVDGRSGPLSMIYMVNGGSIPKDAWVQDPKLGGGRIIGEACHFIDMLLFLSGSTLDRMTAIQVAGASDGVDEDKMTMSFTFADGSIGSVHYFSNGNPSFPKERAEVFFDGKIAQVDNYRRSQVWGIKGFKTLKTMRPEKGHPEEMAAFFKRLDEGGEPLISFDQLVDVTLASIAVIESAKTGQSQTIKEWRDKLESLIQE